MQTQIDSTAIGITPQLRVATASGKRTLLQRAVGSCVYLFERLMPDPFVIVIILTVITAASALLFAPKGSPEVILSGWYKGIFGIFTFAFQMVLVLEQSPGISQQQMSACAGGAGRKVADPGGEQFSHP